MIELKGKRNTAILFTDAVDKTAKTQIAALLREEAYADAKIRIMPDVHAGKDVAVGTTMTLNGRLSPALVGSDIGCGMEVVYLQEREIDLSMLDTVIHRTVPCGARVHETPQESFQLDELYCKQKIHRQRALCSLGTLGGGNHFIEIDRFRHGGLVLVIHSGSRQLGSDVAAYYREQAYRYQCKKQGKRHKQLAREEDTDLYGEDIRIRTKHNAPKVKRETAVLEGELFAQYCHDVAITTAFADSNRRIIADRICQAMSLTVTDRFSCVHNTIDASYGILRKGAVSARLGERVIIPLNMRDGAVFGRGLGNPDWNFSAPHGTGRVYNRTDAKYAFTVEEFQKEMTGIYTSTANEGSLDECPMAYKPPERILRFLAETVEIEEIAKPIYNFKSC